MLPNSREIHELQIYDLDPCLFGQFAHVVWILGHDFGLPSTTKMLAPMTVPGRFSSMPPRQLVPLSFCGSYLPFGASCYAAPPGKPTQAKQGKQQASGTVSSSCLGIKLWEFSRSSLPPPSGMLGSLGNSSSVLSDLKLRNAEESWAV